MDFLTDHVSAELIDTSRPIKVYNTDGFFIELTPSHLRFVKSMVMANQTVKRLVSLASITSEQMNNQFSTYENATRDLIQNFNEQTGEIVLRLDRNIDFIQNLERIRQNRVENVNTELLDRILSEDRHQYVNTWKQVESHNSNPNRSSNASVGYDSSGGGWFMALTAFTISFGAKGVSMSFCSIL